MPPIPPPGIAGAPPCFFGISATMASGVISSPLEDFATMTEPSSPVLIEIWRAG
jgi:hypothetical protein